MPYVDKEDEREYQRAHYQANKGLYKQRAKANRLKQRRLRQDYVRALKESTPCADCDRYFPYYAMDFDHCIGDKEAQISYMVRNVSLKRVKEEIAKCEIVCAICHRRRTHERLALLVE